MEDLLAEFFRIVGLQTNSRPKMQKTSAATFRFPLGGLFS